MSTENRRKKKTQVVTTVTETAKRKGPKDLTKKNLDQSTKTLKEKAASTREVMYAYPKDCTSPEDRKEFRRKARATKRRLEKATLALKESTEKGAKSELKELNQKLNEFKQTTYTNPN